MVATTNPQQHLAYRDKFRSLHKAAFQSWFEELARVLHPAGEFQPIRSTNGDGGMDGFAINAQIVYQVYAPARMSELRDSITAAKIRSDFDSASSHLNGKLKAWVFVHNHPEAKLGKLSIRALNDLKDRNPGVVVTVLDIDSLWGELQGTGSARLEALFSQQPAGERSLLTIIYRGERKRIQPLVFDNTECVADLLRFKFGMDDEIARVLNLRSNPDSSEATMLTCLIGI